MKNAPESQFTPHIVLCVTYGIMTALLVAGSYGLLRALAWGVAATLNLEGWRDICIAMSALILTGWLWTMANIVGIMICLIIPDGHMRKWHEYAQRFSLLWLLRYIEWLIDVRRPGHDMSG